MEGLNKGGMGAFSGLLLVGILIGCYQSSKHATLYEMPRIPIQVSSPGQGEWIPINLSASTVQWKGTKLLGTGSHEGTVKFEKGVLLFSENDLAGGQFRVDMTSIYNTDIPLHDPVPRKNLTTHLNSDLETKSFPTSHFDITKVQVTANSVFKIRGDLTIKGITRSITLDAHEVKPRKEYHAQFTFDRFDWNIGENGSWLERKLVDKEVTLTVTIVL